MNKPKDADTFHGAREALLDIVSLSLDSDEKLIPHASRRKSVSRSKASVSPIKHKVPSMAIVEDEEERSVTPLAEMGGSTGKQSTLEKASDGRNADPSPLTDDSGQRTSDQQSHADTSADIDKDSDPERDPDDFTIMTETQAKRISALCELTFGVQLSTDVVVADANVAALARRVLGARSLTRGQQGADEVGGGHQRRGREVR